MSQSQQQMSSMWSPWQAREPGFRYFSITEPADHPRTSCLLLCTYNWPLRAKGANSAALMEPSKLSGLHKARPPAGMWTQKTQMTWRGVSPKWVAFTEQGLPQESGHRKHEGCWTFLETCTLIKRQPSVDWKVHLEYQSCIRSFAQWILNISPRSNFALQYQNQWLRFYSSKGHSLKKPRLDEKNLLRMPWTLHLARWGWGVSHSPTGQGEKGNYRNSSK